MSIKKIIKRLFCRHLYLTKIIEEEDGIIYVEGTCQKCGKKEMLC